MNRSRIALAVVAALSAGALAAACSSGDGGGATVPVVSDGGAGTDGAMSTDTGLGADGTAPTGCGIGKAAKCDVGEACAAEGDCTSRNCSGGVCKSPSCTNGKNDGTETGIDCGGACADKCDGAACAANAECKSRICDGGKCAAKGTKTCGVGTPNLCVNGTVCEQDPDCSTDYCSGALCSPVDAAAKSDGRRDAGETGVDCGGAIAATQPCPGTEACKVDNDCQGLCKNNVCSVPTSADGKKNNGETDVDCGGPNAPKCNPGKACSVSNDCNGKYCKNSICVTPTAADGVKNGGETDIDCGGGRYQAGPVDYTAPKCAVAKACAIDSDCVGDACFGGKCIEAKSCKRVFGGNTCGTGEVEDNVKNHESCCRQLEVVGFADPVNVGKVTYLDKYEITAGRIRTFVETIAAANNGIPNIKAWLLANKPAYWNDVWTLYLPEAIDGPEVAPLPNANYPGMSPSGGVGGNMGTNFAFGATMYHQSRPGDYTDPYYIHGANLVTTNNSYGFPTYWYPPAVQALQVVGTPPRAFPQEQLDVKAASAIPNAIFAAFCHWDGGRLATQQILAAVAGTTAQLGGRLPAVNINISSDGSQVGNYQYPPTNSTADGAARISAGGRVVGDRTTQGIANQEPWADLAGNLNEIAFTNGASNATLSSGAWVLMYRGLGYSSARAVNGATKHPYPFYKAAMSGARCSYFR
jgi:hypothetical protein